MDARNQPNGECCICCLAPASKAQLVRQRNTITGQVRPWCRDVAACRARLDARNRRARKLAPRKKQKANPKSKRTWA